MKEYWLEVYFNDKPTISRKATAANGLEAILMTAKELKAEGETDVLRLHIYYITDET